MLNIFNSSEAPAVNLNTLHSTLDMVVPEIRKYVGGRRFVVIDQFNVSHKNLIQHILRLTTQLKQQKDLTPQTTKKLKDCLDKVSDLDKKAKELLKHKNFLIRFFTKIRSFFGSIGKKEDLGKIEKLLANNTQHIEPHKPIFQKSQNDRYSLESLSEDKKIELYKKYNLKPAEISLLEKDKFFSSNLLFEACKLGHIGLVKFLINEIDDNKLLSKQESMGDDTPLHYACSKLSTEIISLLIEKIDTPEILVIQDVWGFTPLHVAVRTSSKNALLLINSIDTAEKLTIQDKCNATPLHYACENGFWEVASLLIKKIMDPEKLAIQDQNKTTPLHTACNKNNTEVALLIINKTDTPENLVIQDLHGVTALHHACACGNAEIASSLIEKIKDPEKLAIEVSASHSTPLHYACIKNATEISSRLIKKIKDPQILSKQDFNGDTPLHLACKCGNKEIVKLLINAGVDTTSINKQGKRALDLAAKPEVINLLKGK